MTNVRSATDWMWNIVDVRDTADAQRRMAESFVARNGSRYLGWSPSDGSGELTSFEVVEVLHRFFAQYADQIVQPTDCSPSAEESAEAPKCGVAGCTFSKKSEDELGLRCHIVCTFVPQRFRHRQHAAPKTS